MSAVEAPKTLTEKAKLDELRMQGDVVLPGAEMTNLQMPDAAAGDIASQAFVFDARPTPRGVGANLGFMGVSITVTPIANTTIGAMVLKDMKLAAMIGKLKIEEIRVPLSVLGVTLQQISLEGVKVAQVSL